MTDTTFPVPDAVVRKLGHAYVEMLAHDSNIRALHLKGPAVDSDLRDPLRPASNDIDVLVDPGKVRTFLRRLRCDGWSLETGFEAGSPFAHAATLRHSTWGYLDVHRHWPGFELDRQQAFELLWADHRRTPIAEFSCAVPSSIDQRILLCLNAIRNPKNVEEHPDVASSWEVANEHTRARMLRRVSALHADVAFSIITGDLESHRHARSYRLWKETTEPTGRVAEWRARFAATDGIERLRLVARAPWVNRSHLTVVLGHSPSGRELLTAQAHRWRAGTREAFQRVTGSPR